MWCDVCGKLKLRFRTDRESPVERLGLHRLFYFLIFEAP
jgi:hypothetical protein